MREKMTKKSKKIEVGDGGGFDQSPLALAKPLQRATANRPKGVVTNELSRGIKWDSESGEVVMRYGGEAYRFNLRQWGYLMRLTSGDGGGIERMWEVARGMGISEREYGRWVGGGQMKEFLMKWMADRVVVGIKGEAWWIGRMCEIFEDEGISIKNRIEAGKEIGSRVAPKVERVQHEFEDVDFVFSVKGGQGG
jgi:hypothetical protein